MTDGAGGRDLRTRVRSATRLLVPPPRVVDWGIGGGVAVEVASGLVSFTVGSPAGAWVVWLHSVVGFALVALLALKLWRVRERIVGRATWDRATPLSILQAVVAVAALGTGAFWALGGNVNVAFWTTLNVHVGLGLLLVPLVLLHLVARFHSPADVDRSRRAAIGTGAALVFGALTWRATAAVGHARDATRRFTGSRPTGELYETRTEGGSFPVTSWVADDPDPVERDDWTLDVVGDVDDPLVLSFDAVDAPRTERGASGGGDSDDVGEGDGEATADELTATLDCTSGWYTVQDWQGLRVGDLLAAASVGDDARYVRFVSVTGYRWSLPVSEARDALLATRVGGERLSHGHGAPARLVAPGRRGFQWVKWVERVEVRRRNDPAQWIVTLISGFD